MKNNNQFPSSYNEFYDFRVFQKGTPLCEKSQNFLEFFSDEKFSDDAVCFADSENI